MKNKIRIFLIFLSLEINSSLCGGNQVLTLMRVKNRKTEQGFRSLEASFLSKLKALFHADTFIETGTYLGYSTETAATIFENAYSIEMDGARYSQAVNRLKHIRNIFVYQGDSGVVLPRLLSEINQKKKIVFWLDGHLGDSTPIMGELVAIKNSGIKNAVILIDDMGYFKSRYGYPDVVAVRDALRAINSAYEIIVYGDIMIAFQRDEDIEVSPLLYALTLSRFYDFDTSLKSLDIVKIEEAISKVSSEEKEAFWDLSSIQGTGEPGVYPYLWYGLVFLGEKDYQSAYQEFKKCISNDFNSWRVWWYFAQSAQGLGLIDQEKSALERIFQTNNSFQPARDLYTSIAGGKALKTS